MKTICIHYGQFKRQEQNYTIELQFEQIIPWFSIPNIWRNLRAYDSVTFACTDFGQVSRPFLTAVMCRLLSRKECFWKRDDGSSISIDIRYLLKLAKSYIHEHLIYRFDYKFHRQMLNTLKQKDYEPMVDWQTPCVYVRGNMPVGLLGGGSVTHAIGVINNLPNTTGYIPKVVSFERIPEILPEIEFEAISKELPFRNVKDYMSIAANTVLYNQLVDIIKDEKISFIYQRNSINCYAGIRYAIEHNIPFVLEYNSSEIWTNKHWGKRKNKFLDFSESVEQLVVKKADLITCVSTPLKQQLIQNGIPGEKIIVTPNGVDTLKYNDQIDGSRLRKQYKIDERKIVIGFIGTFGKWHGTELLTEAFVHLCRNKDYYDKVQLLLVGDGANMPIVCDILQKNNLVNKCILTGNIEQEKGPEYLAACDILVSPTLKNTDGTPFFGSPTKIFEYMAMGKAIIASDMDQIAEILENEKTAILVEPNSVNQLELALKRLINDGELRRKLGEACRKEVCRKYTWKIHVLKIYEALISRYSI